MAEVVMQEELSKVALSSYSDIFQKMASIKSKHDGMPVGSIMSAFGNTGMMGNMYDPNPNIQNRRVKAVQTLPHEYKKDDVAEMIKDPMANEKKLRSVGHALEYSAYPMYHTRTVYQNLLTYHWYFTPDMVDDTNNKEFWREYKLLNKVAKTFDVKAFAHEVTGQALQEGKVFYYPRYKVDKAHNQVYHAFLQQLPSDWCKIVGMNNKSKYTIAFNLMYFCEVGTDFKQFGNLFNDYIGEFNDVVYPAPKGVGDRLVYASKSGIDLDRLKTNGTDADAYYQNGRWFYWVTLPVDEVFTFEIDDTNRNVASPFTGIYLDMLQLAQLEAIQLELVQNPLVSLLTGEIPYFDDKNTNTSDQIKLSNAGRLFFETVFENVLRKSNTSGIGFFGAPFHNMQLHSLAESPSAMDIVRKGYADAISKQGLSAIIPVDSDARAGAVQVSFQIESKYAQVIYECVERMMNCIIEKLRLRNDWEFKMFGDMFSDPKTEEACKAGMTLGILPDTITYNALHDRTLLDDICVSSMVIDSGLMEQRIPLQSSYNSGNIDINGDGTIGKSVGRPRSEDPTSDGGEQDIDSEGTARFEE